jgi:glycosyltransferase involved in cell wall biosynthesis
MAEPLGVVVIGRNEGQRLRRCLESIVRCCRTIVYVDSGSTDRSPELARRLAVICVDLDMSIPFTAARARNAGLARLLEDFPDTRYVQFVDGDCEVVGGWLEQAARELDTHPQAAAVCGRLRERFPDVSVYNRLCDMEWDGPCGVMEECGGIVMMRVAALAEAGGFRPSLIAGEEPELCARLRGAGWTILRLRHDMAWHDAAMTRLSQWWRRSVRSGYAFAEVSRLHRGGPLRIWARQWWSNWLWGLALPLIALTLTYPTHGLSLLLLLGYPGLAFHVYRRRRTDGASRRDALVYALFCLFGKFAHAVGQLRYVRSRIIGRPSQIIEYKSLAPVAVENAS